jgi:hypothetical protein
MKVLSRIGNDEGGASFFFEIKKGKKGKERKKMIIFGVPKERVRKRS